MRDTDPSMPAALLAEADPDLRSAVQKLLDEPGTSIPRPAVGSLLGPYCMEESLGSGGMGSVYRGVDTRLGRQVAIKIPPHAIRRPFRERSAGYHHPQSPPCTLEDAGTGPRLPSP